MREIYSWEYTQLTQVETDYLIDQLQHGGGVDPIACTKRWVEPPDYVRFSGAKMSKAELRQLNLEETMYVRRHGKENAADKEWLRQDQEDAQRRRKLLPVHPSDLWRRS